jgi:hypothetical protein
VAGVVVVVEVEVDPGALDRSAGDLGIQEGEERILALHRTVEGSTKLSQMIHKQFSKH